jgi:hypothetical protein
MKQELVDKKYLLIPNFIDRVTAQEYGDEFIKDDFKYQYESDYEHAPNAAGLYNPIGAAELLCNKTAEVSEIIGETVVPTYSFGRIYRQGDELLEHTDRAACEISLTVHLWGDDEWFFSCYDKVFSLNSGDAILYLGTLVPHKRIGAYAGNEYAQFFLHYVRSRGCHKHAIFDSTPVTRDNQTLIKELNGIR